MRPGSVLFMPRGTWHWTAADEPSLQIVTARRIGYLPNDGEADRAEPVPPGSVVDWKFSVTIPAEVASSEQTAATLAIALNYYYLCEAVESLGDKLFHDKRFSSTGEVACANCHEAAKAFTDSPLVTSEGINKLTGEFDTINDAPEGPPQPEPEPDPHQARGGFGDRVIIEVQRGEP